MLCSKIKFYPRPLKKQITNVGVFFSETQCSYSCSFVAIVLCEFEKLFIVIFVIIFSGHSIADRRFYGTDK